MVLIIVGIIVSIDVLFLHYLSYHVIKGKVLKSRKWDLNICCGMTDGGGLNVDIAQHGQLRNFQLISNIYSLPFEDKKFDTVLCSHTIEHVEDPQLFFDELCRIGKEVTLVVPPLWDLLAVLNVTEHKWIFLTFRKIHHNRMPLYIELPFARAIQWIIGQNIRA